MQNQEGENIIEGQGLVLMKYCNNFQNFYIFTKGCQSYTDLLARYPMYEKQVPVVGTFVHFQAKKSEYDKRLKKKNSLVFPNSVREMTETPEGIDCELDEDGDVILTISNFRTGPEIGRGYHEWAGEFGDSSEILEPFSRYHSIRLRKCVKDYIYPWDVIFAQKKTENDGEKVRSLVELAYIEPFKNWRNFKKALLAFFPILEWLPKYDYRNRLQGDITGGLTIGVMHVPQGLAYALLANVSPVVGIYTSLFPALIYMIFGTSQHASIVFRLQFFFTYLSDALVSGYTTGAVVHIVVVQLDDVMGVTLPSVSGPGTAFIIAKELISRIPDINPYSLSIGVSTFIVLFFAQDVVKPWAQKKFNLRAPLPTELAIMAISLAFSRSMDWKHRWGLNVVGDVPTGIPSLMLPQGFLMFDCLVESFGIAVVVIVVHVAMAKVMAQMYDVTFDEQQEVYAMSLTSLFSAFLPVYPPSNGLGRTVQNAKAGSSSLLSTVFSSGFLFCVMMWVGQLLSDLPNCVLSAIILVNLVLMFKKYEYLKNLYSLSKVDFTLWMISFWATVIIDVRDGLFVAIFCALLSVVFRVQWPKWQYAMKVKPKKEDAETCVYRFDGPLLFVNVERFKKTFQAAVENWESRKETVKESIFVLDFGLVTSTDHMGVIAVKQATESLLARGITVKFISTNESLKRKFEVGGVSSTLREN
ncbi:unnamed protein product [Caenorhabditis auriculariae]|uniref:STAS domain-containing protein n=1 Tax=Caenorhabditis auriculariae TaxID=2777116 RepID=A0A8S1GTT8_9PELO|nr:unnamed protein product [Caenorhabditis auriculariae]